MHYTKTAVSIPRDVFEGGEQAAAELGITRSELYTRALRALLRARKIAEARARLDAALAQDRGNAETEQRAQWLQGIASATIHHAVERGESTW